MTSWTGPRPSLVALAAVFPSRDPRTGAHLQRVACLTKTLADLMALPAANPLRDQLDLAARLQDIGKIGIDDAILDKPGPLSRAEWAAVRQYPRLGARLIRQVPTLAPAADLVLAGRERWDGAGYPSGLRGEAIPWGARLLALAGSIEAMASVRPYRAALAPPAIRAELIRASGTQFDPTLVTVVVAGFAAITNVLRNGCPHRVPGEQAGSHAVPDQARGA